MLIRLRILETFSLNQRRHHDLDFLYFYKKYWNVNIKVSISLIVGINVENVC